MNRRGFITTTGLGAVAATLPGKAARAVQGADETPFYGFVWITKFNFEPLIGGRITADISWRTFIDPNFRNTKNQFDEEVGDMTSEATNRSPNSPPFRIEIPFGASAEQIGEIAIEAAKQHTLEGFGRLPGGIEGFEEFLRTEAGIGIDDLDEEALDYVYIGVMDAQ